MIEIAIPGAKTLRLFTAIIDFNGTLARDGHLHDGVARRLQLLSRQLAIHVVTADTTLSARAALDGDLRYDEGAALDVDGGSMFR